MTRILLVCGSQRKDSYNAHLLQYLAQAMNPGLELDFLEPAQVRLPLFDQDLEAEPHWLAHTAELLARVDACDALVVASPEYNAQMTPYLKNLVDWISRLPHLDRRWSNPFMDRPILLCSASTGGSGGAFAVVQKRALFSYLGATVLGPSVCVPYAQQHWTDLGYFFPPELEQSAMDALDRLQRMAHTFHQQRSHGAPAHR